MNTSYPEIYISNEVCNILHKEPQLPKKPIEPQKPKQPTNPGEYNSEGRGCFSIWIAGSVIIFLYVCNSDFDNKAGMIFLSICLFLISLFQFKETTWDKELHEEKQKQYKKDLRSYPNQQKEYEVELEKYNLKLNAYNKRVKELTSVDYLKRFRANLIQSFLMNREKPALCEIEMTDIIKKGPAEDYFKNSLKEKGFIVLDDFKIKAGSKFFYPDIIVEHNGLYLDIEIDEPYVGSDGTPIHYLKNEYGSPYSIDKERNNFCTRHGFEVIRFSEEQVFCHTNECVQLITMFIQSLINGEEFSSQLNTDFKKPKWYYEDSAKMAYRRFRRTYVPEEYVKYIDQEEQHSYQEILDEIEQNKHDQDFIDDLPF